MVKSNLSLVANRYFEDCNFQSERVSLFANFFDNSQILSRIMSLYLKELLVKIKSWKSLSKSKRIFKDHYFWRKIRRKVFEKIYSRLLLNLRLLLKSLLKFLHHFASIFEFFQDHQNLLPTTLQCFYHR